MCVYSLNCLQKQKRVNANQKSDPSHNRISRQQVRSVTCHHRKIGVTRESLSEKTFSHTRPFTRQPVIWMNGFNINLTNSVETINHARRFLTRIVDTLRHAIHLFYLCPSVSDRLFINTNLVMALVAWDGIGHENAKGGWNNVCHVLLGRMRRFSWPLASVAKLVVMLFFSVLVWHSYHGSLKRMVLESETCVVYAYMTAEFERVKHYDTVT